jgi:hypothetical protein
MIVKWDVSRAIVAALVCASAGVCFGQSAPQPLNPGTIVIGECQGHTSEPGCVLPNLFGPGGLSLFPNPVFPHYAHFIGSAQTTMNQTLGGSIATQLAILPIISPSSGFTYKYDSGTGAFVRTTTSFGPIYTERAETIGRGKFSFGASYQRFRFSSLDGLNLHNIPAVFTHVPDTGPGGVAEPYEADVIRTSNNVNLNMDQTLLYGTVGITDRIDFSVAIPIVSVRMGASSDAQIIQVSGPTFVANGMTIPNPHEFNAAGAQTNTYSSTGSAAGLGDVTFRLKGGIFQTDKFRVAAAVDIRAATGDARRFLGSGATGVKPFIAVSAGKRYSPHVNVGYQWNGQSVLAGNLTGTAISEDSAGNVTIQNGPATKGSLPGQFFYSFGTDLGVTNKLTLAFDYLGQTLFDAARVSQSSFTTQNIPGGTGALTLPTIAGAKNSFTINNGAAGLKYNLFNRLLLTADLLFRLDNNGLRQNGTPLVALSYAFGQ